MPVREAMTAWWSRLRGRPAAAPSAPAGAPAYATSWDHLARHDAFNAICDGADAARFQRWVAEALEQPFLLAF